jgi:hypothetical protein
VHLHCLDLRAQPGLVEDLKANFESSFKKFEEFKEKDIFSGSQNLLNRMIMDKMFLQEMKQSQMSAVEVDVLQSLRAGNYNMLKQSV